MATIRTSDFCEPGLYLIWPDGKRLDLTRKAIEAKARAMLDDPGQIPARVRAAVDYQACDICPEREKAEICHAIMVTLPFMDEIDRYMSYDSVTAVFRDEGSEVLCVVETTMQDALQYVTILGLTTYCEVGRKYAAYFDGIDPLMTPAQVAAAVFRSIYVDAGGEIDKVVGVVTAMKDEILHTADCQAKRLRLISQGDAFLNAFVETHTTTQMLFVELRKHLQLQDGRGEH